MEFEQRRLLFTLNFVDALEVNWFIICDDAVAY